MKVFLAKNALPAFLEIKHIPNSIKRWGFDQPALSKQIHKWTTQLPWIRPYYAMKSNSLTQMVKTIAEHPQIGLDAASVKELRTALRYTTHDNIIYTNPHTICHESRRLNNLLGKHQIPKVIDSFCEMQKTVQYNVRIPLIIRLNSNNDTASVKFDSKFGANHEEAFQILDYARKYNFDVQGVSFHVGSGGTFPRKIAYKTAIEYCLPILSNLGTQSKPILDIGGGMLHDTDLTEALGWTKTLSDKYQMVAELGRYFAEPAFHLSTQIIAKTHRGVFLDNGVYHELNGFHRDHWKFPEITHVYDTKTKTVQDIKIFVKNRIFGPTCDSYDTIGECTLPADVEVGDWIFLNNMGAYTAAGSIDFNGIKRASVL